MKSIILHKAKAKLPTRYGDFEIHVFMDKEKKEHVALVSCVISKEKPTLVRLHSECLTGDTLGSQKCDCGEQLDIALRKIAKEGGVLVYLKQEGRGIGLANKILAYALQEQGYDTVEANRKLGFKDDARDYTVGAQILALLGVGKIRLLTNNPRKIDGLKKYGLGIVERVAMKPTENPHNRQYLKVKKEKLGHLLESRGVVR
jgi:3,4-dihydroxy 2-butanone 4-phosphate synthase / GTP cyclohydrolase II